MKSVFKNNNLRQLVLGSGLVLGLLSTPFISTANNTTPDQQEPLQQEAPIQQEAQEFTKTIKKEFPIDVTGLVNLSNKYGKIDVHTWERNRVKVDVTIVVDARSESAAQEVFDRIRIDFSNDDDFVKAATSIEAKGWWGESWSSNKSEFQVNYEVYMPNGCSLELENQYGNANVEAISGSADIQVKYGDFQLEGVGGDLKIELGYGNGTVVKARDMTVDVAYSKINITDAQDVSFDTRYSKINLDRGSAVKADSRYDQFNIGKIVRFNCESRYGNVDIGEAETVIAISRYTDYKLNNLHESADFDIEHGGLRVNQLAKGFSNVNLNGRYADFKIYVEPGASFVLDGNTKYAGIVYPAELNVTHEKDKGTSHEVQGHIGTKGARSVIKANLDYGGLRVRYRE
jgi:hypothetical protein